MQNEPNLGQPVGVPRRIVQNEANFEVEPCETNPISPDAEEGPAAWGEEVGRDANPYDAT